jgi:hypothetical protein
MVREVQDGVHKIFINLGKRDDPGTQAWHQVAAKGIVKWTNGCPGTRHLQVKEAPSRLDDSKDLLKCQVNIGDIPDPESTDHRIHGGIGEWQCPCHTRYPDHVTYTACPPSVYHRQARLQYYNDAVRPNESLRHLPAAAGYIEQTLARVGCQCSYENPPPVSMEPEALHVKQAVIVRRQAQEDIAHEPVPFLRRDLLVFE